MRIWTKQMTLTTLGLLLGTTHALAGTGLVKIYPEDHAKRLCIAQKQRLIQSAVDGESFLGLENFVFDPNTGLNLQNGQRKLAGQGHAPLLTEAGQRELQKALQDSHVFGLEETYTWFMGILPDTLHKLAIRAAFYSTPGIDFGVPDGRQDQASKTNFTNMVLDDFNLVIQTCAELQNLQVSPGKSALTALSEMHPQDSSTLTQLCNRTDRVLKNASAWAAAYSPEDERKHFEDLILAMFRAIENAKTISEKLGFVAPFSRGSSYLDMYFDARTSTYTKDVSYLQKLLGENRRLNPHFEQSDFRQHTLFLDHSMLTILYRNNSWLNTLAEVFDTLDTPEISIIAGKWHVELLKEQLKDCGFQVSMQPPC